MKVMNSNISGETMAHRYSKSLNRGTRRYMEDIAQIEKGSATVGGTYFAIFDGHGGKNAAKFAKKNLWKMLRSSEDFESDDPEKVKQAIRHAFLKTHSNMWNVLGKTEILLLCFKLFFPEARPKLLKLCSFHKLFNSLKQGGHAKASLLL